ncbi:protein FAM167A isoform X1 [Ascaphus truei]|uniref:protein FAM167A isoform X1 n=1 Tax=Ascaphus truei TaxID=8439 RepID=UPI003F59421C
MSLPKIQIENTGDEAEANSLPPPDDHLRSLKALTQKLRLETRRPSYLEWRAKVEDETWKNPKPSEEQEVKEHRQPIEDTCSTENVQGNDANTPKETTLTSGKINGFDNIDEALNWLRKELSPASGLAKRDVYAHQQHMSNTDENPRDVDAGQQTWAIAQTAMGNCTENGMQTAHWFTGKQSELYPLNESEVPCIETAYPCQRSPKYPINISQA